MRRVAGRVWVLVTLLTVVRCAASSLPEDGADRAQVVAAVESNLLSLFGFERRPRPLDRSKVVIPPAMLELYKRQTGLDLDTTSIARPGINARSANTVRTFTHTESAVDRRFRTHHKFRLFFNVSSMPKKEQLKAAEVVLTREVIRWLGAAEDAAEHLQHVLVHDIVRPGVRGVHEPIVRLVDSKVADTRHDGTFTVDVLPAVERWLAEPLHNHGVLVHVVGRGANRTAPARHLRLRRSLLESETEWAARQPLLFTYTDDGRSKARSEPLAQRRARRASLKHKSKRKDPNDMCKRRPLYVDFNDVGWNDWIVAPPGYDAYYCSGECTFPLSDHLNTTNHAIVQTLMNSAYPRMVPRVCCVPTVLNSISMLYLDEENKVVLKNYQDMAVLGCGCR